MRDKVSILNPTGGAIRSDSWGDGRYGASRDGGNRKHHGADVLCMYKQPVVAPAPGKILRISKPYGTDEDWGQRAANNGLLMEAFLRQDPSEPNPLIYLWYCKPLAGIVGQNIRAGEVIAMAESVAGLYRFRYPDRNVGMRNHIHVELRWPGHGKVRAEPILMDWA